MEAQSAQSLSYHSYPKVHTIGHANIKELLFESVTVEEKVDGSQFSFGVFGGQLKCRSKGAELVVDAPEKMFIKAVETAKRLTPILIPEATYRCEYLQSPKHNTLSYDRVPKDNLILFDVNLGHEVYMGYSDKKAEGDRIGLEVVPLIYQGVIDSADVIKGFLGRESCLGKAKIEGVVVKNYLRFDRSGKALIGKFVSEEFKESHGADWKERNPGKGDVIQELINTFFSKARWEKSYQHLRDSGKTTDTPRDIGALILEAGRDLEEECAAEIKEVLFKWAFPQIKRGVIAGLPQWYKEKLLDGVETREVPPEG